MHIADINGKIYERQKRQSWRQFVYDAWCALFLVVVLCLLLWGPR